MVYQSDKNQCGKAVVRTILVIHNEDENFQTSILESDCSNFLEIRDELERNGLFYSGYEIKRVELIEKRKLPAIAQIKNGEKDHFVVIKKITKKKVKIFDPEYGDIDFKHDEFLSIYSGNILLKEHESEKKKVKRLSLLKRKEKLLYGLIFLIETISMAVFLLTLNENIPLFSMISLFMAIIAVFLQFILNTKVRKRLNKEIFIPYMNLTKNKVDFFSLSKIFDLEVKRFSNIVSYSVLLLNLLFLFTANGIYVFLIAIVSCILALIEFMTKKETNKVTRYCSIKEDTYLNMLSTDPFNASKYFMLASEKSNKLLLNKVVMTIFETIVLTLFIILQMFLVNSFSIANFLVLFFLSFSLIRVSKSVLSSYLDESEEVKKINSLSFPLEKFFSNDALLSYTNNRGGHYEEKK